jgi:hypothetical protein
MARCQKAINEAVYQLDPERRVERIGSAASGLDAPDSDLDLTVIHDGEKLGDVVSCSSQQQVQLLQGLQHQLLKDPNSFSVVEMVDSYKVPILRLLYQDVLHVDVSCDKVMAVRNTRLLKAYGDLGPEVRELVLHVKKWAQLADMLGARTGNLSSYAYTLMAIYYLQVEEGLPCLPTTAFGKLGKIDLAVTLPKWEAKRASPLETSELFAGFIRFFTKDFHWGSEVISVRVGKRVSATDITFSDLQPLDPWRIHIEDPFEHKRNLNCVLQAECEMQLWYNFYKDYEDRTGTVPKQQSFPPYCELNSPGGCNQVMGCYAQPQKIDQQASGQFMQQVIFLNPSNQGAFAPHPGFMVQQGPFPQQCQLPQQRPDGGTMSPTDQMCGMGLVQNGWPKEGMQQMVAVPPQASPEEMSPQMDGPPPRGGGGERNSSGGVAPRGGGGGAVLPLGNKAGQPIKQYVICSTTGLPVLAEKANLFETEVRGICCNGECSNLIACRGIHISNIPTDMAEHDLHRTVQAALQEATGGTGTVVGECRVWMSQDTSQKPCFAYAEVEEEASAVRVAKLLNGTVLNGRQVTACPTCSPLWRPSGTTTKGGAGGGRNGQLHELGHDVPVKASGRRGRGGRV